MGPYRRAFSLHNFQSLEIIGDRYQCAEAFCHYSWNYPEAKKSSSLNFTYLGEKSRKSWKIKKIARKKMWKLWGKSSAIRMALRKRTAAPSWGRTAVSPVLEANCLFDWFVHKIGLRPLTLLEPQPRLRDKPLKFQVVCPQNGAAVLKGWIVCQVACMTFVYWGSWMN